MKKVFFAILAAVCLVAALSACSNEPQTLSAPQDLKIEDFYLTWSEVENAEGYTVKIGEEEKYVTSARYDLAEISEFGTYAISVQANGNSRQFDNSEWAEIEYEFVPAGGFSLVTRGRMIFLSSDTERSGSLVLPNTVGGVEAKNIVQGCFANSPNLTSVYIPRSIHNVGDSTFANCTNLKRVIFGEGVELIGFNAFYGCKNLTDVVLPKSVTSLASKAFAGCEKLGEIALPASLHTVAGNAFKGCGNIKLSMDDEISDTPLRLENNCVIKNWDDTLQMILGDGPVPDSVKRIGAYAFTCYSGTAVTIPASVDSISPLAFYDSDVTEVTVDKDNPVYKSDGNCVIQEKGHWLGYDNTLIIGRKTSVIPDYVTAIGEYAFEDLDLTEIILPKSVKYIGDNAFNGCTALEPILLPGEISGIDNGAFQNTTLYTERVDSTGWISGTYFADWDSASCTTFFGCRFEYDDGIPYVESFCFARAGERFYTVKMSKKSPPAPPVRKGYTFGGWATQEGGTVAEYSMDYFFELGTDEFGTGYIRVQEAFESDIVLYAIWIPEGETA